MTFPLARFRSLIAIQVLAVSMTMVSPASSQKKSAAAKKAKPPQATAPSELTRLRDEYVKAAKEYKASLQKLLGLYQATVKKAEDRREQSQKLLAAGLISKHEAEDADRAVTDAKLRVSDVEKQIATADTQIADALVEIETEKQVARLPAGRRGSLIRTSSFIRYNGAGAWSLSQASRIETFFQQTFKRPLPIAVFGQGAIHNQWRLDHHNAMDVSLNPDGPEGQALINFLQTNGIPFSAFRTAIPGVATGPHIHIGMPSHRY